MKEIIVLEHQIVFQIVNMADVYTIFIVAATAKHYQNTLSNKEMRHNVRPKSQ